MLVERSCDMKQTSDTFKFVDLFAGLGGFHVALEQLGGEPVFAAEWDPKLASLYERNFNIEPWLDINDLNSEELIANTVPDHELLTAGFPCQPFSKAGEQLGFEHTLQGRLFFKVFEILRIKQPRLFILENVPNILRHRNGATLTTVRESLEAVGYTVDVARYSPHEFGIPQVRDRAYFVGSLDGLDNFKWPERDRATTHITSIIDADAIPPREIPEQTRYAIRMWGDFLKRIPNSVKVPSFPIWSMEFRATYPFEDATPPAIWGELGASDLERYLGIFGFPLKGLSKDEQFKLLPSHARRHSDIAFPKWKKDFILQNRQFYFANQQWITPWLHKWQPWNLPSSMQKFEWNAQGEVRDLNAHLLQMRASGLRVKRPTTAPSLVAMTDTQVPIIGKHLARELRYMTPQECAKLQSLGPIELPELNVQAYKALGNAVNAKVVRAIAAPLLKTMKSTNARVNTQAIA